MSNLRTAIHAKSIPRNTGAGIVNLKMANGGETGLRGMHSKVVDAASRMFTPQSEKRVNQMMAAPASAAPPVVQAEAPIAAPMGSESVLQRREREAGLQNGGEIQPTGLRGAYNRVVDATSRVITPMSERKVNRMMATPAAAIPVAANAPMPLPDTASALGSQNILDERERRAGLKNGGELCMEDGGFFNSLRNTFSTARPAARPATLGVRGQNGGDELVTGHGGKVPGTGSGDKIPAKYEPGEFVVSNDMLDAVPSLRGELRSLRTHVLAKKGMTPEEADAKAVHLEPPTGDANGRPTVYQGRKTGGEIDDPYNLVGRNQGGMAADAAMAPNSPGMGGREPSGMPTPRGQEGGAGSVAPAFMPSLRGTQQAISSNIQSNRESGNYAGVVGNMLGAVPRYAAAAIDDVVVRPLREINKLSRPTARVGANVAAGAVGQELPADVQTALAAETPTLRSQTPAATKKPAPAPVSTVLDATNSVAPSASTGNVNVTRQPNGVMSFSGGNVTGNPVYFGDGAASLRGGAAMPSGPDVGAAQRKTERDAQTQADIALGNQMQADREAKEAANFASGQNQQAVEQQISDKVDRERARQRAESSASSITGSGGQRGVQQLAALDAQGLEAQRQSGETLRAMQTANAQSKMRAGDNATSLRGAQIAAGASMYGSDVNARTARANAQREGMYKDREFARTVANDLFSQNDTAAKSWMDELGKTYVTKDSDGKQTTDQQLVSDHVSATKAYVESEAKDAEARGRPDLASAIRKQSVSGMQAADKMTIEQGVRMKDIVRKNHGLFGSDFKESNSPTDYRIVGESGGSYKLKNGSTVPKYLVDGGRSWAHPSTWWNPTSSNAFDQLGQPKQ